VNPVIYDAGVLVATDRNARSWREGFWASCRDWCALVGWQGRALAHGGWAHDAVVAVGVLGGDLAELVAGQLGGLGVVRGGMAPG